MIDWTKEFSYKNYCGWCIGGPPSANCDGRCFTEGDSKEIFNNKIDHLTLEIKKTKERLYELETELSRMTND